MLICNTVSQKVFTKAKSYSHFSASSHKHIWKVEAKTPQIISTSYEDE
jgi:hypothetical protein